MSFAKFNPCNPCCFTSACCVPPNKVPSDNLCLKFYQIHFETDAQYNGGIDIDYDTIPKTLIGSANITKNPTAHSWSNDDNPIKGLPTAFGYSTTGAVLTSKYVITWADFSFTLFCNVNTPAPVGVPYMPPYGLTMKINGEQVAIGFSNIIGFREGQCSPYFYMVTGAFAITSGSPNVAGNAFFMIEITDINEAECSGHEGYELNIGDCNDVFGETPNSLIDTGGCAYTVWFTDGPKDVSTVKFYAPSTLGDPYSYRPLFYNGSCEYKGAVQNGLFDCIFKKIYVEDEYLILQVDGYGTSIPGSFFPMWIHFTIKFRMLKADWDMYEINKFYYYDFTYESDRSTATLTCGDYLTVPTTSDYVEISTTNYNFLTRRNIQIFPTYIGPQIINPSRHWPKKNIPDKLFVTIESSECSRLDGLELELPFTWLGTIYGYAVSYLDPTDPFCEVFILLQPELLGANGFEVKLVASTAFGCNSFYDMSSMERHCYLRSSNSPLPVAETQTYTLISLDPFVATIDTKVNAGFLCEVSPKAAITLHISE